jgi:hypothetical protein
MNPYAREIAGSMRGNEGEAGPAVGMSAMYSSLHAPLVVDNSVEGGMDVAIGLDQLVSGTASLHTCHFDSFGCRHR